MRLAGSGVLITGGGSGIGLALARLLLARGARVLACGRDGARLAEAARDSPGLEIRVCDVTDPAAVDALAAHLAAAGFPLDVLVNNAAVGHACLLAEGEAAARAVEEDVLIGLVAPVRLTGRFLPLLLGRPEAAVVCVTSAFALCPAAAVPGYAAAKAGLRAYTQALRLQLRGTAVRVVEVLPPLTDTPLVGKVRARKLAPERVAGAIVDALERDREEVLVGQSRLLALGMRVAPGIARRILARYPIPLAAVK
ncbi:MAG: SDR family NAD(P)-dependent oxidoreductase [Acidobacteria bacterium]|nr:SDR family NAD(P)-dependent oxidoreductase [Acidobacteriota bacterium]